MFNDMKDYIMFGIPKLLTYCDTRDSLMPRSMTEDYLKGITQDSILKVENYKSSEMTGLQMRAEFCLQNIFLTASSSIMNCLLV